MPAAPASKRGVVSLLKPCCVPGYLNASKRLPAAFSAASYGGQVLFTKSSLSANMSSSGAWIAATLALAGAGP